MWGRYEYWQERYSSLNWIATGHWWQTHFDETICMVTETCYVEIQWNIYSTPYLNTYMYMQYFAENKSSQGNALKRRQYLKQLLNPVGRLFNLTWGFLTQVSLQNFNKYPTISESDRVAALNNHSVYVRSCNNLQTVVAFPQGLPSFLPW